MNKSLLSIIIIFLVTIGASAQISGGFKGGVNLVSQKWKFSLAGMGSASEKFDGTGFHIGTFLNYQVNEFFSVQPELLYNQLNAEVDRQDWKFNYISLPVMFGYGLESNKFILQAGPQLGVLISTDPKEMKEDGYMKSVDFSFAVGATLNLPKIALGIRYCLGMANIADSKLEDEFSDALGEDVQMEIKNNNLQLFIGIKAFGN